jgi:arylsulfatase A-like enzyme
MRTPVTASAVLLAIASCGGGQGSPPYEGPYRHVVLVSLDTTRADHLSCYGTEAASTPRLDALAAAGIRFADVTAAAPTTLASHTSLMTGSWPHTHGVVRNGFKVHQDNQMLAEVLRGAGFHTAAFLGSFALESRFDFDQGFDVFDEEFAILVNSDHDQNQRLAEDVTASALRHVEQVKDEVDRLFLFLQYFDPHAPYGPPVSEGAPRTDMLQVETAVRAHQQALTGSAPGLVGVINGGLPLQLVGAADGHPFQQDLLLREAYAAEVAYMDRCLGDLFDGLEAAGVLEEAIVIVTADHGETMYEHHDFWNHGLWLYQTTVHVPLIFRMPGSAGAGRVVTHPVSNVDVLPTLCDLLDLEAPQRCEGVSLVPLLEGGPLQRGAVFSEATQPGRMSGVEVAGTWGNRFKPRCVRRGPWKLIISPYHEVPKADGTGKLPLHQLFNVEDDPGERNDLWLTGSGDPELRALVKSLSRELLQWQRSAAPLPSSFDRSQYEETKARLQQMGYGGGDEDG